MMLDGVDEVKNWFQEQHLERRVEMIELWESGESEELQDYTGEFYEDFNEMMEQIREARYSDQIPENELRDVLLDHGFDSVISLTILDAIEDPKSPQSDLIFFKRNTNPEQLEENVEYAMGLYLGEISPRELQEHISESNTEMGEELSERVYRFVQATIRISIEEAGGIEALKDETRDELDDDLLAAIFDPIESSLERLQRYYIYHHITEMEDKIDTLNEKLDIILEIMGENYK
jgi:hypothetical protein